MSRKTPATATSANKVFNNNIVGKKEGF